MKTKVARMILTALVVMVVAAGAGYGAAGGSQSVSVAAAANIDISVPASASIASTLPGVCGSTSTTINVKSNKTWNLQLRSEPVGYPNGRAKNGLGVEMFNQMQYRGGDVLAFANMGATYAPLYTLAQAKTTGVGRNVSVDYQQCVDYADDPTTYTIVVEYLGVQF